MAYDGKLLARSRDKLEKIKERNEQEHERRIALVYERVPEIERIDIRMRRQMVDLVRLAVSPDGGERLKALKEENLSLQARRAELLVENGWSAEFLDSIYSCRKCKDTGVYQGGVCSCLEKIYNKELSAELSPLLKTGGESFDRFDLNMYSGEYDPALGFSPRECMEKVYGVCRRFAESFPEKQKNLLFQGSTGLGKTFLSGCIAREVAGKGHSVCYSSVSDALETFETRKFNFDEAGDEADKRVRRMLDCDLLILDDLGTEMLTSMAMSALYTVLNTRLVNKKCTVISTNLKNDELSRRYSPQITSRLLGEFTALPFVGQDIRLMKKA